MNRMLAKIAGVLNGVVAFCIIVAGALLVPTWSEETGDIPGLLLIGPFMG